MDRYVDKRMLPDVNDLDISPDDLKFYLNPCVACCRNPIYGDDCYKTCRFYELWELLVKNTEK